MSRSGRRATIRTFVRRMLHIFERNGIPYWHATRNGMNGATEENVLHVQRKVQAEEIVRVQKIDTVEEGRRFATAWIETALQYAMNSDYWEARARKAEALLEERRLLEE